MTVEELDAILEIAQSTREKGERIFDYQGTMFRTHVQKALLEAADSMDALIRELGLAHTFLAGLGEFERFQKVMLEIDECERKRA